MIVGLGIEDTVQDIFQKWNSIFGAVVTEAVLLATLYVYTKDPRRQSQIGVLDLKGCSTQQHGNPPPFCG